MASLTLIVKWKDNSPVAKASVRVIIAGIQISKQGEKTRDDGRISWSWDESSSDAPKPGRDGRHLCHYHVQKDGTADSGRIEIRSPQDLVITLPRANPAGGPPPEPVDPAGTTRVTLIVMMPDNSPAKRASARLTVGGRSVSKFGDKTGDDGKISWAWRQSDTDAPKASGDGRYDCHYYAQKNGAAESGQLVIKANQPQDIVVTLARSRPAEASGTPLDRFIYRSIHPLNQRTEPELLNDIVSSTILISSSIEGMLAYGDSIKWGHKADLEYLRDSARKAHKLAEEAKYASDLADLIRLDPKLGKISVSPIGVGFDLVAGLYAVVDALRKDDVSALKVAIAMTAIDIAMSLTPVTAGFWAAVKFSMGLAHAIIPLLPPAVTISQEVASAIEVTKYLMPDFKDAIFCSPDRYRIDLATEPRYKCKPNNGAGFAFDSKLGLMYIDRSGTRHLMRIRSEADAKEFKALLSSLRNTRYLPW